MKLRVLICGSRTWDDWNLIRQYVNSLPAGTVVIEGEARGADSIARACAKQRGLVVFPFPAHWKHGRACRAECERIIGPRAGPIRNAQMLAEGRPDKVAAFVYNLTTSTGTKDMIKKAKDAGVPVLVLP